MSAEEELREQAEEAKHPFDKKVAASMAGIAAALAVVAMLGHIATTEELLNQQRASDQWAYYQAKSSRRYQSEITRDVLAAIGSEKALAGSEKYSKNVEKYEKDGQEVQEKAREFDKESEIKGRQALRLHLGSVFLEVAIVFASLAILTRRHVVWILSLISGVAGLGIALSTLVVA
jgi:hypothetical protein